MNGVEHGIVGQFVPIPEPSSLSLTTIGILAVVLLYRSRQAGAYSVM